MKDLKKELCTHGDAGGCDITCENCGHTCRRHHRNQGHCEAEIGTGACGCHDYDGSPG